MFFESEELYNQAQTKLPESVKKLLLDKSYNRLEAPTSSKPRSFIFWEKDNDSDKTPDWKKVVRRVSSLSKTF